MRQVFKTIVYQLKNHGIAEDMVNAFNDFEGSTPDDVYGDLVDCKDDKVEKVFRWSRYDNDLDFDTDAVETLGSFLLKIKTEIYNILK